MPGITRLRLFSLIWFATFYAIVYVGDRINLPDPGWQIETRSVAGVLFLLLATALVTTTIVCMAVLLGWFASMCLFRNANAGEGRKR